LLLRSVGDEGGSTPHTEELIFPLAERASFIGVYRNEARLISRVFSAGIMVYGKGQDASLVSERDESTHGTESPR
jgi:hypothetical protein